MKIIICFIVALAATGCATNNGATTPTTADLCRREAVAGAGMGAFVGAVVVGALAKNGGAIAGAIIGGAGGGTAFYQGCMAKALVFRQSAFGTVMEMSHDMCVSVGGEPITPPAGRVAWCRKK